MEDRAERSGDGRPDSAVEAPNADSGLRVVIADDHSLLRRGLRQLLEDEGVEVVAEAGDVDTARRYVRGHHPDVLVLDLNMPGSPSLEAIPEIRRESPATQIVVLTMQDEPCLLYTSDAADE